MRGVTSIRKVLLVRTDRIGDVVLSLPSAGLVKEKIPGSEVHLLTRAYTAPLAAMAPAVGGVLIDEGEGAWALARKLRPGGYDAAVLLHPAARMAAAVLLAGIPIRVGTAYRAYSLLLNRRVPMHRRGSPRHELELNLELTARGLGLGGLDDRNCPARLPELRVSPEDREAAAGKAGLRPAGDLVIVHPGSGGSARDWPLGRFAELIDLLAARGVTVAVTLGPGEEGLRSRLEPALKSAPSWISGLDLGELASLLSLARVVVSNSTGPLHMAAAVGAKAVGIYCPIGPCLPGRWGPYGPGHLALVPEVPSCRRCVGGQCRYWDCMESIKAAQVAEKVMEILKA